MNNSEIVIPPLIPDNVIWWLRMTVAGILCQIIALFGVVTNIINTIIYIKLGIKDPMNVGLLGLSISDFFSCLSIIWLYLCVYPPFMELELPFRPLGVHYLYGSWVHITFAKITILITAFITVERCICVTFPLKVKGIITTKRVAIITLFFYVLNFALASPIYYVNYYDWVFSKERNRTLYTLVFREERYEVEMIMFWFIGVIIPFCAFVITIISTAILVYSLKKNSKWRQEATNNISTKATTNPQQSSSSSSPNQLSSRDTKVARMVVVIAILYLVSFLPVLVSTVFMMAIPEMKEGGTRENLLHGIFYFNFLLETTNASLNIFIYYYMSSNYKTMFTKFFNINAISKKAKE